MTESATATGDAVIEVMHHHCADEAATLAHARAFALSLPEDRVGTTHVHLIGELGAGKTTWVRAALQALGVIGIVRSPTYALLEHYSTPAGPCLHADLYRLANGAELELLGLSDYDLPRAVWFVEWPERAAGRLLTADLAVHLQRVGEGRRIDTSAHTPVGCSWLSRCLNFGQHSPRLPGS